MVVIYLVVLVLDTLLTLAFMAMAAADHVQKNLVGYALKGLLSVSAGLPGFKDYLRTGLGDANVSVAAVSGVLRTVLTNRLTRLAVPRLDGLDVVELDETGRLHSLLHDDSSFEGLAPDRLRDVAGVLPILLLDRATDVAISSPGPILVTVPPAAELRSDSVVILAGARTWDTARVSAPYLIKDRDGRLVGDPGARVVTLVDLVDGFRAPLLKALTGEPLFPPPVTTEPRTPVRLSLIKFGWTRARCRVGWLGLGCRWSLDPAEVQTVVDQLVNLGPPLTHAVNVGPLRFDVRLTNARVMIEGGRLGVKLDVGLAASGGQGPLTTLLANPAQLTNVVAWIDDIRYDRARREVRFARPTVTDFGPRFPLDPAVAELIKTATNMVLTRVFGDEGEYDLRQASAPAAWMLRTIEVADGRLHVSAGLGRCEALLRKMASDVERAP